MERLCENRMQRCGGNIVYRRETLSPDMERVLRHGSPEISNTDQGSQFTGAEYTGVLDGHGVRISMDGRGRVFDNIMIERQRRTDIFQHLSKATDMTVLSGTMRKSTNTAYRLPAELPTVHVASPTSHMVSILAPASTMDNSRIRVPHNGTVLTRGSEVGILGTTWASPDSLHSASDGGRNSQSGHLIGAIWLSNERGEA